MLLILKGKLGFYFFDIIRWFKYNGDHWFDCWRCADSLWRIFRIKKKSQKIICKLFGRKKRNNIRFDFFINLIFEEKFDYF